MDSMKRQVNIGVSSFSFYQCMIIEIAMHCVSVVVFFRSWSKLKKFRNFTPFPLIVWANLGRERNGEMGTS